MRIWIEFDVAGIDAEVKERRKKVKPEDRGPIFEVVWAEHIARMNRWLTETQNYSPRGDGAIWWHSKRCCPCITTDTSGTFLTMDGKPFGGFWLNLPA